MRRLTDSLFILYPELSTEWDDNKNFPLTPSSVTAGSRKTVWWKCRHGHSWQAQISARTGGTGCPFCSDPTWKYWDNNTGLPLAGMDLGTTNPDLAAEWDDNKNFPLTPSSVTAGSGKSVWWHCSLGHSWQARICSRTHGKGCPICMGRQVLAGFNDLAFRRPDLAAEWDYQKNTPLLPSEVTVGSGCKVWWKCDQGHSWQATITHRNEGRGCPFCYAQSRKKKNTPKAQQEEAQNVLEKHTA